MTRPHEPFADAIRTARAIVENEGRAFRDARDGDALQHAWDALVIRIAQAIQEAEEAGQAGTEPEG